MRTVLKVEKHSIAERRGIQPGDMILSINREQLNDEIDYQALVYNSRLAIRLRKPDGNIKDINIIKPDHAPLGIAFSDSLIGSPKVCTNNCIFCFVDQMPPNMRKSLYLKDDDWRLSLMMGNYITLTNVSDEEFDRILRRRASPLYISVHATDPSVRIAMLRHRQAGKLMDRLLLLKEEGLFFHAQIVLCRGINDGSVLEHTLNDLLALMPAIQSIALVPVGLTKYRSGLVPLLPYDRDSAKCVLDICGRYQRLALTQCGKHLVHPADELICLAEAPLPSDEAYENYPQIENGVGMIRQFEDSLAASWREQPVVSAIHTPSTRSVCIACGTSIAPWMNKWIRQYAPDGLVVRVQPVINHFFGDTVTVSGLLTGQDLAAQLANISEDIILLPETALNSDQTAFLDNMTPAQLQNLLGKQIIFLPADGEALFNELLRQKERSLAKA